MNSSINNHLVLSKSDIELLFRNVDMIDLIKRAYLNNYYSTSPPKKIFKDCGNGVKIVKMPYQINANTKMMKEICIDPSVKPGITGRLYVVRNSIPILEMDATSLTGIRTAAKTALLINNIYSRNSAFTVRIHGASTQSEYHIKLINLYFPKAIVTVVARSNSSFHWLDDRLDLNGKKLRFKKIISGNEGRSDVIVTVTSSTSPVITKDNIFEPKLVVAIGSNSADVTELKIDLVKNFSKIIIDSKISSKGKGEIQLALSDNSISHDDLIELRDALINFDFDKTQSILFVSKGLIIEDFAFVEYILNNWPI